MSLKKSKASSDAELNIALEELYADFDKKYGTTSVSSKNASSPNGNTYCPIIKSSNTIKNNKFIRTTITEKSSNTVSERTATSNDPPTAKFQKIDDDIAATYLLQKSVQELEDELFSEYTTSGSSNEIEDAHGYASYKDGDSVDGKDEEESESEDIIHSSSLEPCSTSLPTLSKKYFKSSDRDLKNYAFDMPRMSIGRCSADCRFGGTCVGQTSIDDMQAMINDFWDEYDCEAPSSATRRLKLLKILQSSFDKNTGEFNFYAGCKDRDNRKVCEAGFLILLGISNSPYASKAPGQWRRLKKYVFDGKDAAGIEYRSKAEETLLKAENKSNKMKSALTFIEYFAKEFGDTIPGAEGTR